MSWYGIITLVKYLKSIGKVSFSTTGIPLLSNPRMIWSVLSLGTISRTSWSSPIRLSCTNCIAAVLVTSLLHDAIQPKKSKEKGCASGLKSVFPAVPE